MKPYRALVGLVAASLVGCGGGGGGGGVPIDAVVPDQCSVTAQNQFVLDVMRDIYFWVDELPPANAADFASPEELLEFLAFEELDRFSVIVDEESDDAFFSDSQFIGVGMGVQTREDQLFLTQVFGDGPAAAAGLERGYELLEINGLSAAEIIDGEGISAAFGDDAIGTQVDLRYRDRAGSEMSATLFKALVTIETVSASEVFASSGRTTAYIAFRNFVEPSFEALDAAFADFAARGVTDLVLDLRYNGGGLISVAEFLSGLIGGATTDGEVFAQRTHNSANTFRNITTRFRDETHALDLSRVVVITTGATASASEMIINGLRPFVDVTLVGKQTFGKPVGSYGFAFCGKIIRPISFANENAVGTRDYFDGFAVDCAAEDDLDFALGDPLEASLAEALTVIETGACTPAAAATASQKVTPAAHEAVAPRPQQRYRLIDVY